MDSGFDVLGDVSERLTGLALPLMLLGPGIKFDLVVRKSREYCQAEFARRRFVTFGPVRT